MTTELLYDPKEKLRKEECSGVPDSL